MKQNGSHRHVKVRKNSTTAFSMDFKNDKMCSKITNKNFKKKN